MKKIIYSIMTLALVMSGTLTVTSCSSDDGAPKENPNPNPNPNPDDNPQTQELVVTPSATTAYLGETVTLTATFGEQAVTTGVVYYVNDEAITGNTISSDVEADLLVSAKYQNITSDYVSVTFAVNPFLDVEGEGNFVYNGTSVEINGALIQAVNVYPDNN